MTEATFNKIMALVGELADEELVELQRFIGATVNARRSFAVLKGEVQRPGKRGKRWPKKKGAKKAEGEGLRSD